MGPLSTPDRQQTRATRTSTAALTDIAVWDNFVLVLAILNPRDLHFDLIQHDQLTVFRPVGLHNDRVVGGADSEIS